MHKNDFKEKLNDIKNQFQSFPPSDILEYCLKIDENLFYRSISSISSEKDIKDPKLDPNHFVRFNEWNNTFNVTSLDQKLFYYTNSHNNQKHDPVLINDIFQQIKKGEKFNSNDFSFVDTGNKTKLKSPVNEKQLLPKYNLSGRLYDLINFFQDQSHHNPFFTQNVRPGYNFNLHLDEAINVIMDSNSFTEFESYPKLEIYSNNIIYLFALIKNIQDPNRYPLYFKEFRSCISYFLNIEYYDYDGFQSIYQNFKIPSKLNNVPRSVLFHALIYFLNQKFIDESENHISDYIHSLDNQYSSSEILSKLCACFYGSIKKKGIIPFKIDNKLKKEWLIENYPILNQLKTKRTKYWMYAPGENAEKWDEFYDLGVMAIGYDKLGDLTRLKDKKHIKEILVNEYGFENDPKNHTLANLDIRDNINIGDIVISKRGTSKYLGYGIVDSNYFFDKEADSFKSRRKIKWKKRGEWDSEGFHIAQKTLTDITFDNDLVENIKRIIGIDNKDHMEMNIKNEVEEYKSINKIFFGPPGTGKTFRINQIANEKNYFSDSSSEVEDIINKRQKAFKFEMLGLPKGTVLTFSKDETITCEIIDNERVLFRGEPTSLSASALTILNEMGYKRKTTAGPRNWCYNGKKLSHLRRELESTDTTGDKIKQKNFTFVTFHQSFSYEDFIEGIKPVIDADDLRYEIRPGVFKEICERARKDKNNKYAIFIDEINRGNVSSIFGELITLIEPDKRETMSTILPYSQEPFSVPKNLDIYGTMNTADRSVEALDTALRRRFVFEELPPNQDLVTKKINGLEIDIKKLFNTINKRIEKLIDKDHMIGHSYFMNLKTPDDLKSTFQNKVIPLLQEYFFGNFGKIGLVLGEGFVEKDPESESSVFATFSDYDDSLLSEKEIYRLNDVTKLDDDQFEDILKKLF